MLGCSLGLARELSPDFKFNTKCRMKSLYTILRKDNKWQVHVLITKHAFIKLYYTPVYPSPQKPTYDFMSWFELISVQRINPFTVVISRQHFTEAISVSFTSSRNKTAWTMDNVGNDQNKVMQLISVSWQLFQQPFLFLTLNRSFWCFTLLLLAQGASQ